MMATNTYAVIIEPKNGLTEYHWFSFYGAMNLVNKSLSRNDVVSVEMVKLEPGTKYRSDKFYQELEMIRSLRTTIV